MDVLASLGNGILVALEPINLGLAIIGGVAFLFLAAKWAEYKEEKYYEDREDIAAEVAEAARERGLGDLDALRREYLAQCLSHGEAVDQLVVAHTE